MIIGIDFDNTIADYTGVFYRVALQLGWISADIGQSKTEVKDYFIQQNREPKWTELQGIVYGKEIGQAVPYDGALKCLQSLKEQGHTLYLVSHKTRYPIIGSKVDFHLAAKNWLATNNFIGQINAPFEEDTLFFNETLDTKVNKIKELKCDVFIDDLEKVLTHSDFPTSCQALLFQPNLSNDQSNHITHWHEVNAQLC
ncbi:hypothetical protein [Pseudoalteromonas luteoviolacea]|uniref:Nucleotidase n=1 Tax=Pseudoalteromonas luteoviolacea H33 TaxID=1365251 RepID=A0A167C376_9GAMM|nr:hypothetical protein [Pseudoalteromonas luteoviolacea]KZN47182.1 hypothetical protein N476_23675 [Pseudoalteromonas luteoviolacea H33]KZN77202.1 hypothetical protein N477_12515 [Pseudoalteromonas luteoviolacea H33-S]MBQ4879355.1 HAD family hydrolase [Pseudoalteromonas luteoviolacea]MBQ4908415.1 HAD family hydrolase [Pseudoalteromonas luteoviolacea]